MIEQAKIEAAIAALEAQREMLGDAVVDMALAPLRATLSISVGASATARTQQLKQVTILFIDVVGSTAIGTKLDPEDIHDLMDHALRRFTSIVGDHRGRVLSYTGDGLLAAFGVDEAHEQDAEDAVRTDLGILKDAQLLATEFAGSGRLGGFNVRVGIDTGPVLLGGGVEGENNIRGNAVNLAARMEQSAPEGGLRISHNTYRLVRGLFNVSEESAIRVKGVDELVRTYLVHGVKPRALRAATRGIEGLETRMVGRDAELAQLQRACKAFDGEGSLCSLTIVADAGVGKSRLLREFETWAETQPQAFCVVKGRAQPQTMQQPYGMLRDILAWRFQIADSDSAEVARQRLIAGVGPLFADEGEAPVHLLGHLIGIDFSASPHVQGILGDPQQIRARAFHAAAQLFRRLASDAGGTLPIIMVLDDLHWADDGTLEFFSFLGQANRDAAILIIAFARPLLFERRSNWFAENAHHARINLAPLGQEQARELAEVLLQKLNSVPASLRELLTRGADGNPFFMEETVKMLLDEGALFPTDDGTWRIAFEKLQGVRVPTTLMGVLQARTDGLAAAERIALQQASVIGFQFWDQAVAALDQSSPAALGPLARRGFVTAQTASALGTAQEFTFQHHLLHQFTYDSVLKRERRAYHALAAAWLAKFAAETGNEYLGITGEHHERAGHIAEALDYYTRAAESAAARDAREAAFDFVARALALTAPADHSTRWRLLVTRERLLAIQDDRAKHGTDLDALDALAEALDDDARRAESLLCRATAYVNEGSYQQAQTAARSALAFAERASVTSVVARAYGQLASSERRMGKFVDARQDAEHGLALARGQGDRAAEGELMKSLAAILTEQGDHIAGQDLRLEALAICREAGDRYREADTLSALGDASIRLGRYEAARGYFIESLRLARQLGWTYTESLVLLNLANVAHLRGENGGAVENARAAAAIAATNGARDLEAAAHLPLGLAETALGHWDAAQAALMRSRDLFFQNDGPHLALEPIAALALLRLARQDLAGAMVETEKILKHLSAGGQLNGTEEPLRIRFSCYSVLTQAGDPRAFDVLAEAHAELQRRAGHILDDSARNRFLQDVPHHRAILDEWAKHSYLVRQ